MTLASLKTELEKKGGVAVGDIIVDYHSQAQLPNLTYPLVIWNLAGDGSRFVLDARKESKVITLDVFICGEIDPNTGNKFTVWDTIEALLRSYLAVVNSNSKLQINNMNNITGEYYPFGVITVEGEVGLRYRVELEMLC